MNATLEKTRNLKREHNKFITTSYSRLEKRIRIRLNVILRQRSSNDHLKNQIKNSKTEFINITWSRFPYLPVEMDLEEWLLGFLMDFFAMKHIKKGDKLYFDLLLKK